MVYVLDLNGDPLMPTENYAKVRILLKTKKAKVVRRTPFTIKLLYETTEYIQSLTLGVDTGSGTFATAVSDLNNNIYYMSEIVLRNDIKKKMDRRRKYRRTRRNRKTRYRKARWQNRKNSIKNDRFSPTMTSKCHSHVKEIEFIKSILPIKNLVLETGTFDTHLMKNPNINKHWGYQKGDNYGFDNTKAKVLSRDKYCCQYCKGKRKDSKLEVHHIIFRSNGGSDEEENLITLCHSCHKELHDGKITLKNAGKTKGNLSYATQMNSIRIQLFKRYPEAIETFGYVTKHNRLNSGLSKEHYYDASIIATGGKAPTFRVNTVYKKCCIPKGDYQQTKGIRSEQRIKTTKICGYRKFDKVKYLGREYFIKGRMSTGYAVLMYLNGGKAVFTNCSQGKTPKLVNCKRIGARKSWMIIEEALIQNIA